MRNFHAKPNQKWAPVINLDKLWSLLPDNSRKSCAKAKTAPVVNVVKEVSDAVMLYGQSLMFSNYRHSLLHQLIFLLES